MANELAVTGYMTFSKSPLPGKTAGSLVPTYVTVAGDDYKDNIQVISSVAAAAPDALDFGDIGTPGWCRLTNLSAVATIYLQPKTGAGTADNFAELRPGEWAQFRIYNNNKTLAAYVSAGTANLQVVIFET